MLEIASQITICLLLAALIGFVMGFIIGRGSRKKVQPNTPESKTVEKTETVKKAASIEEVETLIDTMPEESSDEVEIPTTAVIEKVTEALEAVEAQDEGVKPELLAVPKEGKKDVLTQIKGIGPKVEEQLNEAGIYHFEQIANWSEENIKWLEKNTTFAHRAKKDLWINQAKALV
jgi:NADH-quinone oxidoreductase subunit E